jgi:F-type H+-transporting ATPase subunit b
MRSIVTLAKGCGFILCLLAISGSAFCAEPESNWRATYDVVMLWINFLIFVVVLYKVLKQPLKNFIDGQKYQIEKELKKAEEDKKVAVKKIEESKRLLEAGKARFEGIVRMIVQEGERKKDEIIKDAEDQSRVMMEDAKRKVASSIYLAKTALKSEILDDAFDMAQNRLPTVVTESDNQRLLERYLQAIQGPSAA